MPFLGSVSVSVAAVSIPLESKALNTVLTWLYAVSLKHMKPTFLRGLDVKGSCDTLD